MHAVTADQANEIRTQTGKLTEICLVHFVGGIDAVCVEHLAPAERLWSCLNNLDDSACSVTDRPKPHKRSCAYLR
jgi:hypothetical protein